MYQPPFLSAYTFSTSFLNQIGRKITINNPMVLVIGNKGINIKVIRTSAHLILAKKETDVIVLFPACFSGTLKESLSIA
ncbi:MAG: hypothetical protein PHY54_01675 [Methylococcales bacterium]|nr:hypothetical protein [Methylococcales bacterium]